MGIISTNHIKYKFVNKNQNNHIISEKNIIDDVNIDICQGDYIAILGANGSGKTTLAKHLNALLLPDEGNVYIDGKDTKAEAELWELRRICGMVFQNPDNQIIGVTVEEDVGFGPENLGVRPEEIWNRVDDALDKVKMNEYRKHSPNHLSGGQKQKVAIASNLAMKPKCIIFDEATTMLDPKSREEVLKVIKYLNEQEKITIIFITHNMEEVINAQKVMVLDKGRVVLRGTPKDIFKNIDKVRELNLNVPIMTELAYRLNKKGKLSRYDVLTVEEFVDLFEREWWEGVGKKNEPPVAYKRLGHKTLLCLEDVSLCYEYGTNMEKIALNKINLEIKENEMIGIIGHTGAGKSSLIQVISGLIKPTVGTVRYKDRDIHGEGFYKKFLHFDIGVVFQYPENQLFEETVLKDVMFGPINKGFSKEEAEKKAKEVLQMLGLSEDIYNKSPFVLSGGEKRRVAIAGVIAMEPEILILDEPTAGLDPKTGNDVLEALLKLKTEEKKTIIIVSHNMDEIAKYAERIVILHDGKIAFNEHKKDVFSDSYVLEKMGLGIPAVTKAMQLLKKNGHIVDETALTIEEAMRGLGVDV